MTTLQLKVARNRLAVMLVAGAFLVAMAFVLNYSLDPRMYFSYNPREEGLRKYPWGFVLITLSFMLTYSIVLLVAVVDVRFGATWIRSGIALGLLLAWALYISRFVIHMPGYWMIHLLFLWVVVLAVGITFIVSSVRKVWTVLPMVKRGHA
jgi:hypothetical protein